MGRGALGAGRTARPLIGGQRRADAAGGGDTEALRRALGEEDFSPRTFANDYDAHGWAYGEWQRWGGNLHALELEAVRDYQESGYREMNGALRQGLTNSIWNSSINALIDALDRARTPVSLVTYRGLGPSALAAAEQWQVGKVYQDKAFMSTSMSRAFADDWRSGGALVTIQVPKGSRAAYISSATADMTSERELLLQRGTRFRVIRKEMVDGKLHITVRVIP